MGFPGASTKRPLIVAKDKTPSPEELVRQYKATNAQDKTYVGGYSDQRHLIDTDISRGRDPKGGLNHRLHFVRVLNPRTGQPDRVAVNDFVNKGYRFMLYDEAKGLGYDVPPHAEKTAENHIRVGDVELMYCSDVQAAVNEEQGRSAIDEKTSAEASGSQLRDAADSLGPVGQKAMADTGSMNWTTAETKVTPKG